MLCDNDAFVKVECWGQLNLPLFIGFIAYCTNCTQAARGRLTKKPAVPVVAYE